MWGGGGVFKGAAPLIFNISTGQDDWSSSPPSHSVPGKELLITFDYGAALAP